MTFVLNSEFYIPFDITFFDIYRFFLRASYFTSMHVFYYTLFASLMCIFATFLILVNNPIYSVISLILVYLAASFLLVFIEVHFLAVLFILVYLGAVVVLFLFIVMMLNIKVMAPLSLFTFVPVILLVGVLGFMIGFIDINFKSDLSLSFGNSIGKVSYMLILSYFDLTKVYLSDTFYLDLLNYKNEHYNILAFLLYTHFFVELCVAAFVLLLAMVGCIALTLGKETLGLKKQDTMRQILHSNSFLLKSKK